MSYQTDERYWTDYLRVALPMVALLAMLGLFWYWAAALIGNGDDDQPRTSTAAQSEIAEVNASPASTVESPPPNGITPTPGAPLPTATVPAGTQPVAVAPTATLPAQTPPAGDGTVYAVGSAVFPTVDEVNLRDRPSVDGGVVEVLSQTTQLEIMGSFAEDGALDWWPVRNPATGASGFVREDFLTAR